MDVTAIALRGFQAAQQTLETASRRLASPEQSGDLVDLSNEMLSLLAAQNQVCSTAKIIQTAGEMQNHTLDLFA